jgi:CRISPR system Cascade subunit CasB
VRDDDPILKRADELVREVRQLTKNNPADRAALRHSLGRRPEHVGLDVHRIVARHLADLRITDAVERAFYAVPAYMAAQSPDARDEEDAKGPGANGAAHRQNLGESLAHAVQDAGLNEKSIEARLQLLARQDTEGVYRQLPRLILYLRGKRIRIDWAFLIRDLDQWDRQPKQIAKQWMQSYYRTSERLIREKKKRHDTALATTGNEEK